MPPATPPPLPHSPLPSSPRRPVTAGGGRLTKRVPLAAADVVSDVSGGDVSPPPRDPLPPSSLLARPRRLDHGGGGEGGGGGGGGSNGSDNAHSDEDLSVVSDTDSGTAERRPGLLECRSASDLYDTTHDKDKDGNDPLDDDDDEDDEDDIADTDDDNAPDDSESERSGSETYLTDFGGSVVRDDDWEGVRVTRAEVEVMYDSDTSDRTSTWDRASGMTLQLDHKDDDALPSVNSSAYPSKVELFAGEPRAVIRDDDARPNTRVHDHTGTDNMFEEPVFGQGGHHDALVFSHGHLKQHLALHDPDGAFHSSRDHQFVKDADDGRNNDAFLDDMELDDDYDEKDIFRDYDKPNSWGVAADLALDELDALDERGSSTSGARSSLELGNDLDDGDGVRRSENRNQTDSDRVQNLAALRTAHDATLSAKVAPSDEASRSCPPILRSSVNEEDDDDFDLEERLRAEGLALSFPEPSYELKMPDSRPQTMMHHTRAAADDDERAWAEADAWAEAAANIGSVRRPDEPDNYAQELPSCGSVSVSETLPLTTDPASPVESAMSIISPRRRPRGGAFSSGCSRCGSLLERLEGVTSGIGAMQCVTAALAADAAEVAHVSSKGSTPDGTLHGEVAQLRITLDMITRLVLAQAYRTRDSHIV